MSTPNYLAAALFCTLALVGNLHAKLFTGNAGQKCNPADPNEITGDPREWSDPRNWGPVCSPSTPPGPGEAATIPAGLTVNAPAITLGDLDVSGTLNVAGNVKADTVSVSGRLAGGTLACGGLTLTGTLQMPVTISGGMFWNSGSASSIKILPSGFLRMDTGNGKSMTDHTLLENFGSVTHAAGGFYIHDNENGGGTMSEVINHGTWAMVDGPTTVVTSSLNRRHFYNKGTFHVTLPEGEVPSNVLFGGILHNSGTIKVDVTRFLVTNTLVLENDSRVTGSGMVLGTSLEIGRNPTIHAFGNINIGEAGGKGTITLAKGSYLRCGTEAFPVTTFHTHGSGKFDWLEGAIVGALEFGENSRTFISGPDVKDLSQGYLINHGTVEWTGSGNIYRGEFGKFLNHFSGTFIIDTDADLIAHIHARTLGTVENRGTFRKISGAAGEMTEILNGTFLNSGVIDIQSGVLRMNCDYQIGTPANLIGAGKTVWGGNGALLGDLKVSDGGSFELAGGGLGFLNLPDGLPSGVLRTINGGTFLWTGGAIGGVFEVPSDSTVTVGGTAGKAIHGRSKFINRGSFLWNGGVIGLLGSNGDGPTFENRGLFRASGLASFDGVTYGRSRFLNYGTLDIGNPYGTFSTSWVFFEVLEGGVINADIGGTTPGEAGHDQLAQGGFHTGSMGGHLHVRLRSGYTPTPGDSFRLTSGMGGSFADITCDGAHAFHAEYVSGGLNLIYDGVGAEPFSLWKQSRLAGLQGTDASDLGDPDQDGISNFLEHALNTDPRVSGGAAVTPKPDFGKVAFSFSRPHPSSVIYDIETSVNGAIWDSVARLRAGSSQWIDPRTGAAAVIVETGSGTSRDVVRLENPTTARLKQIRLRVTQPN